MAKQAQAQLSYEKQLGQASFYSVRQWETVTDTRSLDAYFGEEYTLLNQNKLVLERAGTIDFAPDTWMQLLRVNTSKRQLAQRIVKDMIDSMETPGKAWLVWQDETHAYFVIIMQY